MKILDKYGSKVGRDQVDLLRSFNRGPTKKTLIVATFSLVASEYRTHSLDSKINTDLKINIF